MTTTHILTAAADTYLRQGAPNRNQGAEPILRVRQSGKNRAVVAFDPVALTQVIGLGAVTAARLELDIVVNGETWGAGRVLDLHRVTTPWTETGATWNCAIDTDPENQARDCDGATAWDHDGAGPRPWVITPTASVTIANATVGTLSLDVTADVAALGGAVAATGWILKKRDEGAAGLLELAAREAGTAGPRLVLTVASATCDDATPITVATVAGALNPVVDGADLFVTGTGGLYRAPAGGGAATHIGDHGGLIALDGAAAYIATENTGLVVRTPRGGGGDLILHSQATEVHAVAVDDVHVYYGAGVDDAVIARRPKNGGPAEILDADVRSPWQLVDGGDYVYGTAYYAGTVYRWPKQGGSREVVAATTGNATYLALDDDHVYFTTTASSQQNPGPDAVWRAPRAGGAVELMALLDATPVGLAVDEAAVWWTQLDGTLRRRAKDGDGPAESVLAGLGHAQGVSISGSRVYWGEYGAGRVRSVCRAAW